MVSRGTILLLVWLGAGMLCGGAVHAQAQSVQTGHADIGAENPAISAEIEQLLADYDAFRLKTDPSEAARAKGKLPTGWPDVSPAHQKTVLAEARALLTRTQALGVHHTLDTNILEVILISQVKHLEQDTLRIPFTGDSGFHSEPAFVIGRTRLRNVEDADAVIARIDAIPAYFDANIANMRRGIATGFVAHTDPLDTVISQLADMQSSEVMASPLYAPFRTLPAGIDASTAIRLRSEANAAIARGQGAYQKLYRFFTEEYRAKARQTPGIFSTPKGREIYRAAVAQHTTRPDLTPERVHEIGLSEVARIRAEMEEVIAQTGFDGSFAEFLAFLRTDPQFYVTTPEALLAEAAVLSKRLDATLPRFFGKLPRLTYGVSPVPADIAPGYTTARYAGGDAETGRAGTYLVNTYRLDQRPLYELPALTAHEAVPGHHLQIALAQELEDVPEFRRNYYATAFGEGWGLYAERLAGEAGLYDTPYKRFGALSYEMWRACRLVADTGLHWYGWSREKAESCFRENSALAELNIQTEVTRYIGWPGQALGYKIGEITIRSLRAEAEDALGAAFDIRDFHDLVLEEGALPLSLLEARVYDWIEGEVEALEAEARTAP